MLQWPVGRGVMVGLVVRWSQGGRYLAADLTIAKKSAICWWPPCDHGDQLAPTWENAQMLQWPVGRGVMVGPVVRWSQGGHYLATDLTIAKNPQSVGDHLAITAISWRPLGDHSATTSRISDFPSCSRNFRDHFEQFKNWRSRSRSSAIGHDRGMVARPISTTLLRPSGDQWWSKAMLIAGWSQRWSPPVWHGLKITSGLLFFFLQKPTLAI